MKRAMIGGVVIAALSMLLVQESAYADMPDPSRFYERKGACSAQRAPDARAACLDDLLAEVLSSWARERASGQQRTSSGEDAAALRAVVRAFAAIRSAVDGGVSLRQFRDLILSCSNELAAARVVRQSRELQEILAHLDWALEAYRDASFWWEQDISFFVRRDNALAYPGGLPYKLVGLDRMVEKYRLPVRSADVLGLHEGVSRQAALSTIWDTAGQSVDRALALAGKGG